MLRVLVAAVAVVALEIGITFLIAFYGSRGLDNLLYWSVPPLAVAFAAFRGRRGKLFGAAGLWPLFARSVVGAELIAHAAGTCLQ